MKHCILILIFISTVTYGQTRKIFHKSHSGAAETLFLDDKNHFGPGMAPVRYRTPESKIKLNYLLTGDQRYPLVLLDTISKTMRFFDLKDSLIGCDRDYREYLKHGALVYDIKTNHFFVYQRYNLKVNTRIFLVVTDSIDVWESKKYIRQSRSFIRDGNNHRIIMTYPILNHLLTKELIESPYQYTKSFPVVVDEKLGKKERGVSRKERRMERKEARKKKRKKAKVENDEMEFVPILNSPPPTQGSSLIRWMIFALLAFALFIFIGVKRIVKEEVAKLKK